MMMMMMMMMMMSKYLKFLYFLQGTIGNLIHQTKEEKLLSECRAKIEDGQPFQSEYEKLIQIFGKYSPQENELDVLIRFQKFKLRNS